ncbi:MAG: hypothetical protein JWP37_3874 [Mucilaginibacter sp.]|nr:hypothetical protein [Mucilaginibacter sp.]
MQAKTLIVVGMHRSGTSLITNWLNHCGLQVGECLLGDNHGNIEGHFEDLEFLRMHEEILVSNNLPSSGLIEDKEINISIYQQEKIKTIIRIKNKLYKQWGWKEPRTCLFLNTYRELLPNSKYLIIVRDYQSVINSLLKRDFFEVEKKYMSRVFFQRLMWSSFKRNWKKGKFYRNNAEHYLKVWIAYNENILDMLKELPDEDYIVINYSLLEKSDEQIFSFLTKAWGFALRYFSFNEVYKENLMSAPIDLNPFIKDQDLLSKAKSVETDFKKYIVAF